ncbi:MAG: molybdate ABC transporter substrate-binding protein [Planctomycetota bacterium]
MSRARSSVAAASALALLTAAACTRASQPRFDVAAAASLRALCDDLGAAFATAVPDAAPLRFATGSSGGLAAQIRRGAPFALLLAADEATPLRLVQDGHAAAADLFRYARGALVLWTRRDLGAALDDAGLAALRRDDVHRVAVANPELAPYGRAALEALEHAGVLDALRPRLVLAENAAQTAHLARSGAVDAALVPRSLAARLGGHQWAVPEALHAPIVHAGLVLARDDEGRAAARRVLEFLSGPQGCALLQRHGMSPAQ